MSSEKKDDAREVEPKPAGQQSSGKDQKGKVSDTAKASDATRTEQKSDPRQTPDKKKETQAETESEKEKKQDKGAADKQDAQPEKSGEEPAVNDLDTHSEVRTDLPGIRSGDIIQVSYRVIEGGKERIQVFEGTVIALKNSGISRTITVRKTSFGISVERIFPLNSKLVQKIQIKKHSKVRRAKLYYLRKLKGKAARLKELR